MTIVLGIDPGVAGALAVAMSGPAAKDFRLAAVYDLPTCKVRKKTRLDLPALSQLLVTLPQPTATEPCIAVIERVGAMPKQGLASAFSFGFTCGALEGSLTARGVPVHRVTPQVWKFAMGLRPTLPLDHATRKNLARAKATEMFPEHADLFARVKDDGRAEAALIALYCARNFVSAELP